MDNVPVADGASRIVDLRGGARAAARGLGDVEEREGPPPTLVTEDGVEREVDFNPMHQCWCPGSRYLMEKSEEIVLHERNATSEDGLCGSCSGRGIEQAGAGCVPEAVSRLSVGLGFKEAEQVVASRVFEAKEFMSHLVASRRAGKSAQGDAEDLGGVSRVE